MDAHYKSAAKLGHGIDYKYSHNYKNHYCKQQYLPDELVGMTFYHLSDNGYEKTLKENLDRIKREAEDDIVERNYTEQKPAANMMYFIEC